MEQSGSFFSWKFAVPTGCFNGSSDRIRHAAVDMLIKNSIIVHIQWGAGGKDWVEFCLKISFYFTGDCLNGSTDQKTLDAVADSVLEKVIKSDIRAKFWKWSRGKRLDGHVPSSRVCHRRGHCAV